MVLRGDSCHPPWGYISEIGASLFPKSVFLKDQESMENGIYTFEFTEEDIMRSELVKFLVKKLKHIN